MEVFKTEREEISASEVPEDIRRQIEEKNSPIAENFFKAAENYFYGLKGCLIDRNAAKNLYEKAAEEGHKSARNKLKNLFGIDYEEPISPIAENFFKAAENYYYGLKGCFTDKDAAKNLYEKAAEEGHKGAKNQLKKIWGIDC